MKIAIQGIAGAFHDIATRKFFQQPYELYTCLAFTHLIDAVTSKESDFGVMAIENTIAGSILQNYQLINESPLFICGETFLRIKLNLMALSGQKIDEIKEIHSHPVAIAQCRKFMKNYPQIKLVETYDTALVAKNIQDNQITGIGAIASDLAAKLYNMEILAEGIETNKKNYTRFLKISREAYQDNFDKVSLTFTVSHTKGSLYKALGVLYNHNVNMTKIQSTPVLGEPFTYRFFADLNFESTDVFDRTIIDLSRATKSLKVLGKYKKEHHEY